MNAHQRNTYEVEEKRRMLRVTHKENNFAMPGNTLTAHWHNETMNHIVCLVIPFNFRRRSIVTCVFFVQIAI